MTNNPGVLVGLFLTVEYFELRWLMLILKYLLGTPIR